MVSIPFTRVEVDMNTQDNTSDETEMTPVEEMNKRKDSEKYILEFCVTPKNALEIADMIGLKEKKSARRHIKPLVEQGRLAMTITDKPNSKNQKYITIK